MVVLHCIVYKEFPVLPNLQFGSSELRLPEFAIRKSVFCIANTWNCRIANSTGRAGRGKGEQFHILKTNKSKNNENLIMR